MVITSKSAGYRQLKNSLARWLITFGGISVLFTLVLIFLYLLYVIKPIFDGTEITPSTNIEIVSASPVLSTGVDELKELAFTINQAGFIDFYQIAQSQYRETGTKVLSEKLTASGVSLAQVIDSEQHKLLLDTQGNIRLISPSFTASYDQDLRDIVPDVRYPLGVENITVDESGSQLKKLAFAMDDERGVFVGFTSDHRLIKTSLVAEDDFNYDPAYETLYQTIDYPVNQVDDILITPDLAMVFIRDGNRIAVFSLDDDDDVPFKGLIEPENQSAQLTTMALLSGGSSLLVGDSQGEVNQWFEVAVDKGRAFKNVRSFTASQSEAVEFIYTERFRKSFYTMTISGELGVFYTTSEADLWHGQLTAMPVDAFAIAPRANALILVVEDEKSQQTSSQTRLQFQLFSVNNEHPEVSWQALWQEVWYEGYPEPDYIWQSTSGSDDFEAKFSLVPISFGTLKAASYAMLFAVPIALTAAIYTAYFMTPGLRRKVKPTIEMMEALPTVILGFLAGLWLAPIVENYLPAIFLLLVMLPMATLITAFAWANLPNNWKTRLPETWAPMILIPILCLTAYLAFMLSPVLEVQFFGGDVRQFITNEMGINFDQRNALVVGIAMGFAVIPTIFSMAEDAIFSVPGHLTSGSLALGATRWQTLIKVVLLTASPGIFSAIMMGLGRAVGETMIVLMATGNTPILDWSIFQGMRTLAANIAVEMPESEVGSSHYRILFLAAFVLFVFTFVLNTLAEFVRQRLREKYSSL